MSNYAPETYYVHKHGGIYKTICLSNSSIDQSQWVIYRHVYPFEEAVWHRPLAEWTEDRFIEISESDLLLTLHRKDRDELKAEINSRRSS